MLYYLTQGSPTRGLHATCVPRVPSVQPITLFRNYQIVTCQMCSFYQRLYLTMILHLVVIVNNIRFLIKKLWLLPCGFIWVFFCPFKIVGPPGLSFVTLGLKRLGTPDLNLYTVKSCYSVPWQVVTLDSTK